MKKVEVYNGFSIVPEEHTVSDSSRATKRGTSEALRVFGITLVFALLWVAVSYVIGEFVDQKMAESTAKKVIGYSIVGSWFGVLLLLSKRVQAIFGTAFKPNLKSPDRAVKTFLSALEKNMFDQAYSLLTDNAQKQEKLEVTRETPMQTKMPDPEFTDKDSFVEFWNSIQFPWKMSEYSHPKAENLSDEVDLVEAEIQVDRMTPRPDEDFVFKVKFATVKRDNLWFVANGFFWPISD